MSRTRLLKIGYLVVLGALALAVVALARHFRSPAVVVAAALVLLVPGRIQAWLCRDLFRARRLFDRQQPAASLPHSERFLAAVRARPWLDRALWFGWPIYTVSARAMCFNNIGAAQLELGALVEARRAFEAALALDPAYPIPHVNLAVIGQAQGRHDAAARHAGDAVRLGYSGGTVDSIVATGQSLAARLEGRGGGRD